MLAAVAVYGVISYFAARRTHEMGVALRSARNLLFGVQASDPTTFLLVTALLAVVALTVGCVPAWRVARTDPVCALWSD